MGKYLWVIGVALIASLASLGLIIGTTTPVDASLGIKLLFFVALVIGIWSLATLTVYLVVRKRSQNAILSASAFGFLVSFVAIMAILIRKLF